MTFWRGGSLTLLTVLVGAATSQSAWGCDVAGTSDDTATIVLAAIDQIQPVVGSPTLSDLLEDQQAISAYGTCTDGKETWAGRFNLSQVDRHPTADPKSRATIEARFSSTTEKITFRNQGVAPNATGSSGTITLTGDDGQGAWVNRGTFGNQADVGASTDIRIHYHNASGTADMQVEYDNDRKQKIRCFGTFVPTVTGIRLNSSGQVLEAVAENGDRLMYSYSETMGDLVRVVRKGSEGDVPMHYQWKGDHPYRYLDQVRCPDGRLLEGYLRGMCQF